MKNLVKVAAVALLSLGFGVAANAQNSSKTIAASASVVDQIEVVGVQDLTFGNVMQGLPKHVGYQGNISGGGGAQGNPTPGIFNVFAAAGTTVTLAFTTPENLTFGNANLPIVFDKDHLNAEVNGAAIGATSGTGATEFKVASGTTVTNFSGNSGNDIDGRNGLKVFIGGTVRPGTSQPSGAYTGTITLTATYN